MTSRALSVALAAVLAAPGIAAAQQYRWVDPQGVVRYSDRPPPPSAKSVERLDLAAPKPQAQPLPFELQRLQRDFPVILYTSPNCREGCDAARKLLNARGIPFQEKQVWEAESNEELKRVSGANEVPTLLVGRSVQRGFEQGAFNAVLDSAGYPRAGTLPARSQKAPPPPEGYVAAGEAPKPEAKPVAPPPGPAAGPYDTSGLRGPEPKPGPYDPSSLTGPPPKPGQYLVPGETK